MYNPLVMWRQLAITWRQFAAIWRQFASAVIDNKVTRNYILLIAVKRIGLPYRQKEQSYLLVIILEDLIAYKGSIINLKIGPI